MSQFVDDVIAAYGTLVASGIKIAFLLVLVMLVLTL